MTTTRFFAAAISGLLFASLAHGQGMVAPSQGTPRISTIMPMGAQAGSEFELRVTGQDLADPADLQTLHFNFPGVKVEMTGSDTTLIDKKKGQPQQALTTQKFKVSLPANSPLGIQDVRIVTKKGMSNPRAFVVSDHKEFVEQEPNNDVDKANRIELNSTVNGVISVGTDVDFFVFAGKKGQRVVISCLTTSIDSRLNAFIQLYSLDGSYLGGNRNYSQNDALVDAVLPADGDYHVRVASFSYTQGGIDYFYRLTVTTAPWIDAVFPAVVEPGKSAQVTVYGRNLPGGKIDPDAVVNDRALEKVVVTVKAPADARATQRLAFSGQMTPISSMLDGFDLRLKNEAGQSNPFLITYGHGAVVTDNGDNGAQAKALQVPTPCTIAGRIDKKGDRHWYAFSAKKGQVFNIDAFAERLGAPMDLYYQIRTAQGALITEQDDNPEVLAPQFYTKNDDPPRYRFVAQADDTYYIMATTRDAFTQYGPRHLYTLRITPEEPDFRLVAMPTSQISPEGNVVNKEGGAAYTVFVWRTGGFSEEITLSGENLPPGVGVRPQIISSGQKQAVLVVHAEPDAKPWAGGITILGTATVKGQKLSREVRSATISWAVQQNNIPTITRMDRELTLAVRDKAQYSLVIASQKINVPQGEKISIPVKLVGNDNFKTTVQVAAIGGPPGLIPSILTLTPGQGGTATLDVKGGQPIPPGNYTVFLRGQTQPINPKQPAKGNLPPNIVQISMPVSVTIVPKVLGKMTAVPAASKVSVGKNVEITVKFARAYDLPLALKVEAILPPNLKGVTAKDVVIKPGEEEAKIVFTVAPDATIGATPVITLRATAMFNETVPIVHETKVTLAITK
jgi:hypothetical protein